MKKIKIVFFIYRLGGGGAARTILNIINYLDRDQFEPILVTLDFTYDYERFVREDVTFIKIKKKRLRSAILPLAKLLREERPTILFSTVSTYNIIAIIAKLFSFTKTKVIIREAALLGGTKKENFKLRIYGQLYRFANKVISLSEGVKQNLISVYHVQPKKIQVIYNPVDIQHIESVMQEKIDKDILDFVNKSNKVIVTAGRMVKEKDHISLLKAFSLVQKKLNCGLIILGEGVLKEDLQAETKRLEIDKYVHFAGFQQNPYAIFHHVDLFVLTSTTEGFGHVLVEAMVTKIPIVSTNAKPGVEEVLQNGEYGFLCEVGNVEDIAEKILTVLSLSDEQKVAQTVKGRKRVHSFRAEKIVKQYEQLFLT